MKNYCQEYLRIEELNEEIKEKSLTPDMFS